jgi:outer membrane biosynthesis protein TonB
MGFFSFIENFFFISLGIVFILVLLLVYHFKQRMSSVERKGDTMYELVVNMVKEIRFLRAFYPSKEEGVEKVKEEVFTEKVKSVPEVIPGLLNTYSGSAPSALAQSAQSALQQAEAKANTLATGSAQSALATGSANALDPVSYFIREASNKIVVSDDSGSDTDSTGSDLDSDEDEESDDDESVDYTPLNNIEVEDIELYLDQHETEPLKNIGVEDVQLDFDGELETAQAQAVQEDTPEPAELEPEPAELEPEQAPEQAQAVQEETLEPAEQAPTIVEESSSDEEPTPVYTADNLRKMNINQLKSVAISSGITVDTSKMKKNELITLLLKE